MDSLPHVSGREKERNFLLSYRAKKNPKKEEKINTLKHFLLSTREEILKCIAGAEIFASRNLADNLRKVQ